jgi:hypothetical protein
MIKSTVMGSAQAFLQMGLERTIFYQLKTQTSTAKNRLLKANSSYTKQYSNPYGPMQLSYAGQPPIPTSKSSDFNPRLSHPF